MAVLGNYDHRLKAPSSRFSLRLCALAGVGLAILVSLFYLLPEKQAPAQEKMGPPPTPGAVTYLPLQNPDEGPYSFDRNASREWTFHLAQRPVLARLEGEVYHSGFNAPLRVEINGNNAGILRVNLPSLRDGTYRFFQAPRPGTAEGQTIVADAAEWVPAWAFLERPFLREGINRIRLSSTLDRLNIRNLRLELLPALPPEGALDLTPDPASAAFEKDSLTLPPLVTLAGEGWKNSPAPRDVKYTALYFSAHWCGPCRVFTPKLVEWYQAVRPQHPEFELVFVSSDRSSEDMLSYMKEARMPWPAIPFDQIQASGVKKWSAGGIPYLILFGPDGRPITAKDRGWRPPQQVMEEIGAILAGRAPAGK